jgi:hypothetical protein
MTAAQRRSRARQTTDRHLTDNHRQPPRTADITALDHGGPQRAIPLAGDLVEAMAKRIGADRLMRLVNREVGSCLPCAARRDTLNRLDRRFRKYLGWSQS